MDTLENAYQCLTRPGERGLPQHSLQLLVEQMHAAAESGNRAAAQACMQELVFAADHLAGPLERAQARLECARVAFQLQDEDSAMQHLGDAIRLLDAAPEPAPKFTPPLSGGVLGGGDESCLHTRAMARWMLATLLVAMPGGLRSEALVAMQQSLDGFTRLVVYSTQGGGRDFDPRTDPAPSLYGGEGDWYRDRCAEMRKGIKRLVQTGSLGVPQPAVPPPGAAKRPAFKWPISTLYAGNLQSLRVIGQIPAGGFGPTSIDAHARETLPLQPSQDEFTIAAVPHRLVNLRGSPGITQLVSSNVYFILQVTGDSMDLDHIDPGDYVLLRQQSSADPMDIVAAEVVGIDPVATLKRFLRKDGEIVLEPRSANPAHTPFKFKAGSRSFQVRGVVLGVFKS